MPKMECLPLYAALSPQQQMRIWDSPKPGKRRVILSTNIGKVFNSKGSEFRKGQYRDDDHREDAPHFMRSLSKL